MTAYHSLSRSLLLCAAVLVLAAISCGDARGLRSANVAPGVPDRVDIGFPPSNPFLSEGAHPAAHYSGYSQGSSPLCAPTGQKPKIDFLKDFVKLADPIVLAYTNDNKYMWGSSITSVFKIDRSTRDLKLVDSVRRRDGEIASDIFHGAYSLLDQNDVFFTSISNRIEAWHDDPNPGRGAAIMKNEREFVLPTLTEGEVIRALCMTSNGNLAFGTNMARIGVVDRNLYNGFTVAKSVVSLKDYLANVDELKMSNNIACDGDGGIYAVSNRAMHKVQEDSNGIITHRWTTTYLNSPINGNLLGEGSGTTPSLVATEAGATTHVVITDGSLPMNIVVFDANTGDYLAHHPVTFNLPAPANETTFTEQSVTVYQNTFVVVNNAPILGRLGLDLDGVSNVVDDSDEAGNIWTLVQPMLKALVRDVTPGVQQFKFTANTLTPTWARNDITIPNGIPAMSAATGLMYGVGKRGNKWTIEGLNWKTGDTAFTYELGRSSAFNSLFAGMEVGPDCELVTGVFGGVVRVRV